MSHDAASRSNRLRELTIVFGTLGIIGSEGERRTPPWSPWASSSALGAAVGIGP